MNNSSVRDSLAKVIDETGDIQDDIEELLRMWTKDEILREAISGLARHRRRMRMLKEAAIAFGLLTDAADSKSRLLALIVEEALYNTDDSFKTSYDLTLAGLSRREVHAAKRSEDAD